MASVLQGFDEYSETPGESEVYDFVPKHERSTKNNPLCGICLPQWLEILYKRHRQIDWITYWPRLIVISLLACINSLLAVPEWLIYGRRIEQTKIDPRPVFVLGHPRTGTTLLHSLLALDTKQFAICTTFCSGFPSSLLWFERLGKTLFSGVIDDTRPMDNVKLHFDLPQEDELATNVLSAGTSAYMPIFFMKQERESRPYYAYDNKAIECDEALPGPVMAQARKRWTNAFLYLLRKLTLRDELLNPSSEHRLLLKSPVHTARIPLLLSLFPDAQFIYIHRNPYDVFRSSAHMADTTYWYSYLNTPSKEEIQEFILRQYEILWDRYEEGRAMLRDDQLMEVSFDELANEPLETVRNIYQHFQWKGWENNAECKVKAEVGEVKSYKRNRHRSLSPELKKIVEERWGPSFDRLGYKRS